ncbi:MAG TPA: PVC-type heme-binding CxxCH protein [Pirellulales bacterium]|nr:PVC-type heme-binding CxxCH protein [Pirellulales bacterium]
MTLILAAGSSVDAAAPVVQPRAGFQAELVAAEPLIESPIALDWGADGRLWVVEMRDYPLGVNNQGEPGGRIVCVEDTDQDGRYDRSTLFLDGLLFPTGVMTWRKGVLITCAPDILYAEDTDGDGKADKRESLFTGFGEANPQHRVNGLRWGLDNWIYCANGDFAAARTFDASVPESAKSTGFSASQGEDLRRLMLAGASIQSNKTGESISIRNRDFRIQPDEGRIEPQSGQAQFGRDRDDWGNWFGCNNAIPIWHFVLDDFYLRRNPHAGYPPPRVEASTSVTYPLGPAGRDTGAKRDRRGSPWTSACSITFYRDNLFGPDFDHNWFVCEPVHNLVHREVLIPAGATFQSHRAPDESASEFLSSTDTMFSPVSVRTGPDGAVWVVDMYRKVLEHPHWLPAGWEETIDVRAGHDKGRIYRVFPAKAKCRPMPRLDRLDSSELVATLESPNGWVRDKAQQLLVERQDRSASPALEELARASAEPRGRLHALCALDGLHALDPKLLEAALADPHPAIRRQVIRLAEKVQRPSNSLQNALFKLTTDPAPMVRLQLAYTLGSSKSRAASQSLARILRDNASEPYIAAAAVSSLTEQNTAQVLDHLVGSVSELPEPLLENLLRTALGFGEVEGLKSLFARMIDSPGKQNNSHFAAVAVFLDALDERNESHQNDTNKADADVQSVLNQLAPVFGAARAVVVDGNAPLKDRVQAVRLLGRLPDSPPDDQDLLYGLLNPQIPDQLQIAAVEALGRSADPQAFQGILREWKSFTPAVREQVLETLLRSSGGPKTLLDAIQQQLLLSQEVSFTAQRRLLEHPSEEVRNDAGNVFQERVDADREKVIQTYQPSLQLAGDLKRGQPLFEKHCAACHRLGEIGHVVGPDLAMVRDKAPEWFLPAIFDPSRAVDAKFVSYVAVTDDGRVLSGILGEESGERMTLIGQDGKPQSLLRGNVEQLSSTGKSLMPDGLEKVLKSQDVADLIAFLRSPIATKPANK